MRDSTLAMIEQLRSVEWFHAAGERLADASVKPAASWPEAVELCTSVDWENFRLRRRNELTRLLHDHYPERYHLKWNGVAREVRPAVVVLVESKAKAAADRHHFPPKVMHTLEWNIAAACMEDEYADVRPSRFYGSLVDWYLRGRFPCSWEGEYPGGRLVVY